MQHPDAPLLNEVAGPLGVAPRTIGHTLLLVQGRSCRTEGVGAARPVTLGAHKDVQSGRACGTLIRRLRIERRALFIILDRATTVRHVECVSEVAPELDCDAALAVARRGASAHAPVA